MKFFAIKQSQAPENFPRELLELLWKAFGKNGATSYDIPKILDRLVRALPLPEVDRRLQSLEQRTMASGSDIAQSILLRSETAVSCLFSQ